MKTLKLQHSRTALQFAVFAAGFVPVLAGGYGVLQGSAFLGASPNITLDSHFHYLSGLLLGIGLCFWSFVPHIEARTTEFRLLTFVVFVGGLSRLLALMTGMPSVAMIFGLCMELIVTPCLCLWQYRIAKARS